MRNLKFLNEPLCALLVTGDIVGKILAWCSLLPIFIVVGFITLIVFRREIHTVSLVLNMQLHCEA